VSSRGTSTRACTRLSIRQRTRGDKPGGRRRAPCAVAMAGQSIEAGKKKNKQSGEREGGLAWDTAWRRGRGAVSMMVKIGVAPAGGERRRWRMVRSGDRKTGRAQEEIMSFFI
jgi:hypothetical protein